MPKSADPTPDAGGDKTSAAPPADPLLQAKTLYARHQWGEAILKYQEAMKATPNSPEAYAGLTRVYLKQGNLDRASDTIAKALEVADSPAVRVALGEVDFRQGKIRDAEQEWVNVLNSGHREARACLGVARVRMALAMYQTASSLIDRAHQLDPTDPDIQEYWEAKKPRAERIQDLETELAGESHEDAETRTDQQHYLEFLKAREKDSRGGCRLVSTVSSSEAKLVRMLIDPTHIRGYGLSVALNGQKSDLLLDTGASGILISRGLAHKAGLTKITDTVIRGIGDKGDPNGYIALADSIRVGDLEFQGCAVEVMDRRSVVGEDGLIGANVFSDFLVDINFPDEKLSLSPLPLRPGESASNLALNSEGRSGTSEKTSDKNTSPRTNNSTPARSGPRDAYIAPEMKSFTPFYLIGHDILLPTYIGDSPSRLFLMDTGGFSSMLSPQTAEEVTKLQRDTDMRVKGISGSVEKVYRADKAQLRFGNVRQRIFDLITFDMTSLSQSSGTEISGILGFTTLRFMDIKIDYRDGVIDFKYDPKRWEH